MIEQRLVQAKRFAAIVGAEQSRRIDAGKYGVTAKRCLGLERPDRIERSSATPGKLDIALGRFVPVRTEIVRPRHHRAPMLTLVADQDSRRHAADECDRRNRLPEEMRTRHLELAAVPIREEKKGALYSPDHHEHVAGSWRKLCGAIHLVPSIRSESGGLLAVNHPWISEAID